MNKKTKFFFLKENSSSLAFLQNIRFLTIEDLIIIDVDKGEDICAKNPIYISFENNISNFSPAYSFYLENNPFDNNLLGMYWNLGNDLGWNKDEGKFISFASNSTYEINSNEVRLKFTNEKNVPFNFREKGWEVFLIVSFEY